MAYRIAQLGLVSLLASTVVGLPSHARHAELHDKRAVVTVTVTAGAAPAATPAAAPAANAAVHKPAGGSSASGSSSGSIGGKKAGLAYNDASLLSSYGSKFSWAQNWAASAGTTLPDGISYVPCLKDTSSEGAWSDAASSIASSAEAVFGYNEADVNGISASYAAGKYPSLMTTPFAGKLKIGTPSATSSAGSGAAWLSEFIGACSACKLDFAASTWYANKAQSAEENAAAFKTYFSQTLPGSVHGLPIWITEFGYVPPANDGGVATNPADEVDFLNLVIPWLNSQENIAQYAYFMVGNDAGDMIGDVKTTYINTSD